MYVLCMCGRVYVYGDIGRVYGGVCGHVWGIYACVCGGIECGGVGVSMCVGIGVGGCYVSG